MHGELLRRREVAAMLSDGPLERTPLTATRTNQRGIKGDESKRTDLFSLKGTDLFSQRGRIYLAEYRSVPSLLTRPKINPSPFEK
jgi:hypothetical protein